MNKTFRCLIVLAILGGIVFVAGQRSVWASPPPPIDVTGDPETGSGDYKLGGCVTGSVTDIKPGYKLNVALLENWNSYRTEGLPPMPMYYWTLPGGPDDIFSCVTVVQIMQNDKMLKEFPVYKTDEDSEKYPFTKGSAQVCLDTPLNKEGYIYYYDEFKLFYDKNKQGENYPNWVVVGGPFPAGSKGCVPVKYSGVYAYYAPEPDKELGPDKVTTTVTYHREGSVDVPSYTTTIAMDGAIALGGCVTGNVEDLAEGKDYQMDASLVTSLTGVKALPENVGKFYECIIDLKLQQGSELIDELPEEDGNVTICFAIPPKQKGTIYYLDKYFNGEAEWVPVGGEYKTGIACGPVMKSGYYGMVDVKGQAK